MPRNSTLQNRALLNAKPVCLVAALLVRLSCEAADQFFAGDGSALTASKWAATSAGPFSSAFTSGNVANFSVVNGTGAGAGGITVSGLNATENFTYTTGSGTLATGGTVIPVTVAAGKTLNIDSTLAISTAAGVGFIKNGSGALAWAGSAYTGGFTLNAGTLVSRGVNAMGAGGALTINGGTIAASATRDLAGKYASGITVAGDFQLGALASAVSISSDTANITFNNNMSLGAATRTIMIGANGNYTLGGIISGNAGVGLTVNALSGVTGTLTITNANTYSGNTTISGGTLSIAENTANVAGKLGNESGTLVLNGGTLFRASQNIVETHLNPISITDNSTISGNPGSGFTRNLTFSTGSISLTSGKSLTIRGLVTGGIFELRLTGGGFNWSEPIILGQSGEGIGSLGPRNDNTVADQTYSGLISGPGRVSRNVSSTNPGGNSIFSDPGNSYASGTEIRGGFIGLGADNPLSTGKITIGSDPNPLGLFASGAARQLTNSITADIALANSTNFQVRGSQDLTLSGGFVITNTMFFTISNSALTTFSGVITNVAVAGEIVKQGFGRLVLSGSNVYSGTTTIREGALLVNNLSGSGTSTGLVTILSGATLGGTGIIAGIVTNNFGGTLQPGLGGTNTATLTISNALDLNGTTTFVLNRTNAQSSSRIAGLSAVKFGGTLTLTNVGTALQAGDTFTLFSSAAYSGAFTNYVLPAIDPSLIWVTNNLSVNGSVSVAQGVISTTLSLSSASNPSGYLNALTFTANVTPSGAAGSVIFYAGATPFSTNSLTLGNATSVSISSLARGTNTITAIYGGSLNYYPSTNTLAQAITNHPPIVGNAAFTRYAGMTTLHIAASDLLTNVTDADLDTVSVVGSGVSTNGVTLIPSPGYLNYYNVNNVDDQFTYTVSDGFGGTNSATVTIVLNTNSVFGLSSPAINTTGGSATLSFAGIPGLSYSVVRSTNVTFVPLDILLTTNAPAGGLFDYTDSAPPQPSAYYRLQWNP